jgi:hypothetical protein
MVYMLIFQPNLSWGCADHQLIVARYCYFKRSPLKGNRMEKQSVTLPLRKRWEVILHIH